jgi:hypothetical protein
MSDQDQISDQHLDQALGTQTVSLGDAFSSRVMVRIIAEKLRRTRVESLVALVLLGVGILVTVFAFFVLISHLGWFQFQWELSGSVKGLLFSAFDFVFPCVLALITLFVFDGFISRRQRFVTR